MAKPNVGTIILVFALIISVGCGGVLFAGLNSERSQRMDLQKQLNNIRSAKHAIERERDELVKAKTALQTQADESKAEAENLAQELAAQKRSVDTLTQQLAKQNQDSKGMRQKLESEREEKLTLTDELAKAKQSYRALSNELTTLRQAKEALERRVKEMLQARVGGSEPIVVTPQYTPPSVSSLPTFSSPGSSAAQASNVPIEGAGKVLVVNNEFNFVVVNLGSSDGLEPGRIVSLYRNNKKIGRAEVERVYANMAAANLLVEELSDQPKEGDEVRVTS